MQRNFGAFKKLLFFEHNINFWLNQSCGLEAGLSFYVTMKDKGSQAEGIMEAKLY